MYKFTYLIDRTIFNPLSSLLDSGSYDSFDNAFGHMCLVENNRLDGSFCATVESIYFAYGKILRNSHNTKLLDYYFEYINSKINYSRLREKIFDYALSFNICELWELITVCDVSNPTSIFLWKYIFRICQTNNIKAIENVHYGSTKLHTESSTHIVSFVDKLRTCVTINDRSVIVLKILKRAIAEYYIEIIDMFSRDTVFNFDKHHIFKLLSKNTSIRFLKEMFCRKNNIFITQCVVSVIPSFYSTQFGREWFIVFCELLLEHNVIQEIAFDKDIISPLLQLSKTTNNYLKVIEIIVNKNDLNIPREIFLLDTNTDTHLDLIRIRSKLFSHRFMLILSALRQNFLLEICSIIMNFFVV